MRLVNGKWQCANCGAPVDAPNDAVPRVMLVGASGKPNMRVLLINGEEVHRCEVKPRAT